MINYKSIVGRHRCESNCYRIKKINNGFCCSQDKRLPFLNQLLYGICYSHVWKYFKIQMLNTAKTSMSNCHIYFVKEKRAGKLHKLKLVPVFLGILSLMPNIDWITESRILPAALRDPWDFSLFHFRFSSFHISHEHGHRTFYCLLFPASNLMVQKQLAAFLPSTHTVLCSNGSLVLCF